MQKITVSVDGMMCGMCEKHVNEAVEKVCKAVSVTSSHEEKQTVIITKTEADTDKIKAAIEEQGYKVGDITVEPYEKKGFFSKFRK